MFEWLSGFMLNPAMAVGAGAVASPILIHILSKRRYQRVRWAAMEFLLDAQRRNRRRVRLEQLLLLFLRCLAVFLIALMMTRPFVRPGHLGTILGTNARTERLIMLDDSYSMQYQAMSRSGTAGRPIFEQAKKAVLQIRRWVAEDTPEDSLTLFVTSNPAEPVITLPGLSVEHLIRLEDRLKTLQPSETVSRMAEGLGAIADLIRRSPTQANSAVYVISDFQRDDWVLPADPAAEKPPSVASSLAKLADEGESVKLVLVNMGDASAENTAITGLVPGQPQVVAGVPARFEVGVSNHSDKPLNQVELSVSVAQHRLPPVVIPKIHPGQTVREPVEITFPQDGSDYLQVELAGAAINEDGLRLDNARAMAVEVVPAVKILIVDGEVSNDPYRDETYLLKTALRPAGRAASGNELSVIDEQELDDIELDGQHVVVLANVGRLGRAAQQNLEAFVRGGGGLIVFAGDQIDIDYYNAELYRDGEGVIPMALGEVEQSPPGVDAMTFKTWDAGHPVMQAFVDRLADVLRQVRIFAYVPLTVPSMDEDENPSPEPEPAAASNGAGEKPRAPARVIARFNDADESPAIVQRRFGRGLSVFVATSADQEWNDWASNFSYLPMMLELVQYAAKASDTAEQAVVNAPIICPLDATVFRTTSQLRTPDYPIEPEITLEAVTMEKMPILKFNDTDKSGIYQFLLTATAGTSMTRYAAVNPDPTESDLDAVTKLELEQSLSDMPFEYLADLSVLAEQAANAKQELWWPLLLAVLCVLMSEHVLAWWFGSRG